MRQLLLPDLAVVAELNEDLEWVCTGDSLPRLVLDDLEDMLNFETRVILKNMNNPSDGFPRIAVFDRIKASFKAQVLINDENKRAAETPGIQY